jgi:threonine dehydrogenase-like Zn-dependent dehydrogenase
MCSAEVSMRAITLLPGVPDSARLDNVPEPDIAEGSILVRTRALGVCGTDREILAGLHGAAPVGEKRLILGHESLGLVERAPAGCGFRNGDLIVGIVRRPDPVPCPACAAGEWDMCRNGLYTERGIKERHGFGSEFFRIEPEFAVKADPSLGIAAVLIEPASVVAKAWNHVDGIGHRSASWRPYSLLVTGAGPIGLLGAMIGKQRGLDVHVLDRHRSGPKPELSAELGATYHASAETLRDKTFDVVLECTASSPVIVEAITHLAPSGIVCLVGVSAPGRKDEFDIGGFNRRLVLNNGTTFGSVNANLGHYRAAEQHLLRADHAWIRKLITRRVPLERWQEALDHRPDDIKVIVDFGA